MTRDVSGSVLWAEDNKRDRMLIEESLDGIEPAPDLVMVSDGVLLLQALEDGPPALVVLDLKMPRMGGIEVLRTIRANPSWKEIPVSIFTSGNRPSELAECTTLGVRAIFEKPVDFDLFSSTVKQIVSTARAPELSGMMNSHER